LAGTGLVLIGNISSFHGIIGLYVTMILITGASGKTGRALIKALSKAESVCVFVHREEQVAVLKSLGAEKFIVGDLRDGAAIRSSIEDVRAVYHICPNMSPDEMVIGKLVNNPSCYQRKLMLQARTKSATLSSKPLAVTA
jgi:NAD(P)-dependent dehydrogenase (short-subunit alcohol dehydrogenase family)